MFELTNTHKEKEKYYWINDEGEYIPKSELTDLHVCNIVCKFGKIYLIANGHATLVERFEALNANHKFFNVVQEK